MAKDLTAIRIDGELIEKLKRISAESDGLYFDRSVNWLIGQAVREFVERHAKQAAFEHDLDKPVIATKRAKKIAKN